MTMIEKAQRRLRQARFFYNHLVNVRPTTVNARQPTVTADDPEAFRFYLGAFIQSARSVTWTIGKEEPDKWEAWKPKWEAQLNDEERRLLKLTRQLRNAEEKEGGADLTEELEEVVVQAAVDLRPPIHWERDGLVGGSREVRIVPRKELRPAYYFGEGKEEISALCWRYLQFLEKTVDDFSRWALLEDWRKGLGKG
jgi:hypothetical protein